MLIGYSRVSTLPQDIEAQREALLALGVSPEDQILDHGFSGKTMTRDGIRRVLTTARPGDRVVVPRLDRLARNTRDLLNILHAVKEAGAGFRSIAEPMVDTTSQLAEVVIAVLGVAASYERQRIAERTNARHLLQGGTRQRQEAAPEMHPGKPPIGRAPGGAGRGSVRQSGRAGRGDGGRTLAARPTARAAPRGG